MLDGGLGWSYSRRCSWINSLLIMNVMHVFDYALNDHTYNYAQFYQLSNSNLFTIRDLTFERDATSEPMAPGSILN